MSAEPLSPRDQLLKEEYFFLQKTVEDFDQRSISIKNWSVSFGFAAIAGAFASKASVVFLIAAGAAAVFWLVDAYWKGFQHTYYPRITSIEMHFSNLMSADKRIPTNTAAITPLQIANAWREAWAKDGHKKILMAFILPGVWLPNAVVVLVGVVLYLAS